MAPKGFRATGRPKSSNIQDKRNYFGSMANSQMQDGAAKQAFYIQSISNASKNRVEGTKLQKRVRGK